MSMIEIEVSEIHDALDGLPTDRSDAFLEAKILDAIAALMGVCPVAKVLLESPEPLSFMNKRNIRAAIINAVVRVARDDGSGFKSERESAYEYTRDPLSTSPNIWFTDKELGAIGCSKRAGIIGTIGPNFNTPYGAPNYEVCYE